MLTQRFPVALFSRSLRTSAVRLHPDVPGDHAEMKQPAGKQNNQHQLPPAPRNRAPQNAQNIGVNGVRTQFLQAAIQCKNLMPHDLLRQATHTLIKRTKLPNEELNYLIVGMVIQEAKTLEVDRAAALGAGLSERTPAHTVTMACISSNGAITTAIGLSTNGQIEGIVAGGVHFLSDVPIRLNRKIRQVLLNLNKAKSLPAKSALLTTLVIPVPRPPEAPAIAEFTSGETMEHSADPWTAAFAVSRRESDEYALRFHSLASEATKRGDLKEVEPCKYERFTEISRSAEEPNNGNATFNLKPTAEFRWETFFCCPGLLPTEQFPAYMPFPLIPLKLPVDGSNQILPSLWDIEKCDPVSDVLVPVEMPTLEYLKIEKLAARLIRIRRRKMKRHQYKKLKKRMGHIWEKYRERRKLRRLKVFYAEQDLIITKARKFDPEIYVKSFIAAAKACQAASHAATAVPAPRFEAFKRRRR